jgi:type I restriction enzyme S subunit
MRPYLRAANVTWAGLDLSDVKDMNFTEEESTTYELRPGDVLVAEASGSVSEVGKPAIWRGEIEGCCFQNTLIRVRTFHASSEFLRYLLLLEARSGRIGNASPGVGIHHIGATRLSAWPIPLPPLNEQRRIVAAIEEHLSRLDAADVSLREAQQRLASLKEVILSSALVGDWPLRLLSEIAVTTSGGTPSRKHPDYFGGSIAWVKSGELRDSRVFATEESLTDAGLRASSAKVFPRGTLLVALYGATIGKLGVLEIDAATNQAVCAIKPHDPESIAYLRLVLRGKRADLIAAGQGGAQPNISQAILRRLVIPMPPLEDQERIVAEVEARVTAIDALHGTIERAMRRSTSLRRAVLERAFRGELVPQDPSDEPASVLLERIRAERAATPAQPRRRRVSA